MRNKTLLTMAVAALTAATLLGTSPQLFARGDSGGGSGGGGSGGGGGGGGGARGGQAGDPENPPPTTGTGAVGSTGNSSGGRPDNRTDLPEFLRDGEEQRDIARDARGRMARSRFRDCRDARNRAAGEPSRDGSRR